MPTVNSTTQGKLNEMVSASEKMLAAAQALHDKHLATASNGFSDGEDLVIDHAAHDALADDLVDRLDDVSAAREAITTAETVDAGVEEDPPPEPES